jgi:hypothetical protein
VEDDHRLELREVEVSVTWAPRATAVLVELFTTLGFQPAATERNCPFRRRAQAPARPRVRH